MPLRYFGQPVGGCQGATQKELRRERRGKSEFGTREFVDLVPVERKNEVKNEGKKKKEKRKRKRKRKRKNKKEKKNFSFLPTVWISSMSKLSVLVCVSLLVLALVPCASAIKFLVKAASDETGEATKRWQGSGSL